MRETILDRMERTRTIESYGLEICITDRDSSGAKSIWFMESGRTSSFVKGAEPPFSSRTYLAERPNY